VTIHADRGGDQVGLLTVATSVDAFPARRARDKYRASKTTGGMDNTAASAEIAPTSFTRRQYTKVISIAAQTEP
jgi:hypothetical protein